MLREAIEIARDGRDCRAAPQGATMFDSAYFHPLIVHAPLVLIPVAILFELLHSFAPKAGLRIAAVLLLAGGVAGAVLATETGEAAEKRAEQVAADRIPADGLVPQVVA